MSNLDCGSFCIKVTDFDPLLHKWIKGPYDEESECDSDCCLPYFCITVNTQPQNFTQLNLIPNTQSNPVASQIISECSSCPETYFPVDIMPNGIVRCCPDNTIFDGNTCIDQNERYL